MNKTSVDLQYHTPWLAIIHSFLVNILTAQKRFWPKNALAYFRQCVCDGEKIFCFDDT